MHELGYCEALLPAVDQRAGGRAVHRIGITAGVGHRLVPDVMQMAWQIAADGTPYADATTVLEQRSMTGTCRDCGHRFHTDDTLAECPECGALGPRLDGGDEFMLAWLQYADAPDRDVARSPIAGLSVHDVHDHDHDHEGDGSDSDGTAHDHLHPHTGQEA